MKRPDKGKVTPIHMLMSFQRFANLLTVGSFRQWR